MAYNSNSYILLTPLNGVPYRLMEGYPQFVFSREESTCTEKYLIVATTLQAFLQENFPPPTVFEGRVIIPNTRTYPGSTILYTKKVTAVPHTGSKPVDPFGFYADAPDNTFDQDLLVTIEYSTSKTDDQDDELYEHSVNAGGEFFTLPPQKVTVTDEDARGLSGTGSSTSSPEPNKDFKLPISKVIPTIEHSFRYRFVQDPNWALYQDMLGTVNANRPLRMDLVPDEGTAPHIGVPSAYPGTVLFMGVSGSQRVVFEDNNTVTKPWDLDFKFSHKHHTGPPINPDSEDRLEREPRIFGWNHFYIPAKGDWEQIHTNTGALVHRLADHNEIFGANAADASSGSSS